MKIKRFFATDIRDAIRQVRAEQGPDAVILSNTQVSGGVEIVAAVDYDESLFHELVPKPEPKRRREPLLDGEVDDPAGEEAATLAVPVAREQPAPAAPPERKRPVDENVWTQEPTLVAMRHEINDLRDLLEHELAGFAWGSQVRQHPIRTRLLRELIESGFSPRLCMETAERIPETRDFAWARRMALGILAHGLKVTRDDIATRGGIVALIGPTGVGKTTTIAKLAARHTLKNGARSVALITTDNYRVGAHDQLRTYARLLDVPLRVARSQDELQSELRSLESRSLVLIDTAGMSQRAEGLKGQLAMFAANANLIQNYLVMSAATEATTLDQAARAFGRARLKGCILTKLDEAGSLGGVLSILIQHKLPIAYFSDGQRVPEDLQVAQAHSLISRGVVINRSAQRGNKTNTTSKLTRHVEMASTFGRLSSSANV